MTDNTTDDRTDDADSDLTRRGFLAGSAATVGTASGAQALASSDAPSLTRDPGTDAPCDAEQPNVVLIYADDLGYGELDFPPYNRDQVIETPNLRRMGQEGVRFSDFYAGSAVCSPSRCSTLTGQHTGHTNVRSVVDIQRNDRSIRPQDTTIGDVLGAVGYHTALIGKWHLMEQGVSDEATHPAHPNSQGFDEFFGAIRAGTAQEHYPTELWHNREKVQFPENEHEGPEALRSDGSYAPDIYTERVLDYIETHQDGPFFLDFAIPLVHAPNVVPDFGRYEDEPWPPGEKAHAARVTLLDEYVGRILDKLRELDIADETLVLFTSDNGPHCEGGDGVIYPQDRAGYAHSPEFFDSNGPLRGYKINLYEGGVRVPMIAWSPGLLGDSAGRLTDHPAAQWDILPTLADYAGAEVPSDIDGISFRAAMEGREQRDHDHLYFFRNEYSAWHCTTAGDGGRYDWVKEAVRRDDWKAVRYTPTVTSNKLAALVVDAITGGAVETEPLEAEPIDWRDVPSAARQVELYDLSDDVDESRDVSQEHPEVVEELVGIMEEENVPRPVERAPFEGGCARGRGR